MTSTEKLTVYAANMLYAQGFKLSTEERAELTARADRVRGIMSAVEGYAVTDKQAMNVPVKTPEGATIGYLTYQL